MAFDYSSTERIVELSFAKFDKHSATVEFPKPGTLAQHLSDLIRVAGSTPILQHHRSQLLASASVEMWHRAIHSFLWSLALTEESKLWASISGYYASHFVMRAFAHAMGFFKCFTDRKIVQVVVHKGQFVCSLLEAKDAGEHAFYWKVVKDHPSLTGNPLFRGNSERDKKSDSAHRNFANYTDHVNSFVALGFPTLGKVTENVEKISRIRLHSVTEPSREDFPDLFNVQILAFQRIVAFHDFLDERIPKNRFWRAHRRPAWCNNVMSFQVENQGVEQPLVA
jgi:hypothetical protein